MAVQKVENKSGPRSLFIEARRRHLYWLLITVFCSGAVFAGVMFPFANIRKLWEQVTNLLPQYKVAVILTILALLLVMLRRLKDLFARYLEARTHTPKPLLLPEYLLIITALQYLLYALFNFGALPDCIVNHTLAAIFLTLFSVFLLLSPYRVVHSTPEFDVSDDPITRIEDDILGRGNFVNHLKSLIIQNQYPRSFVISIEAPWGEGKSSVLNLAATEISKEKDVVVIRFDPWHYNGAESMLRAFYKTIANGLKPFQLSGALASALESLSTLSIVGVNIGVLSINLDKKIESVDDAKVRVQSELDAIGKRIIIMIDDLDRLSPDSILAILSTIRLNADLKNVYYVLAIDRNVVCKLIEKHCGLDSAYLNKIIQQSITLPSFSQDTINRFVRALLNYLVESKEIDQDQAKTEFENDFWHDFMLTYSPLFQTIRDAKRFYFAIDGALQRSIVGEINLSDFFKLEILRTSFYGLYDDILMRSRDYLTGESIGLSILSGTPTKREQQLIDMRSRIEGIANSFAANGQVGLSIVRDLFPNLKGVLTSGNYSFTADNYAEWRREKRVCHQETFGRYFSRSLLDIEISDQEIGLVFHKWNQSTETSIDLAVKDCFDGLRKTASLGAFLKLAPIYVERIDKIKAEMIVIALASTAKSMDSEQHEGVSDSEWDNLLWLVLTILNNRLDEGRILSVLLQIITNVADFYFASALVLHFDNIHKGTFYNLYLATNIELVRDRFVARLQKHFIAERRNIFYELSAQEANVVVYRWAMICLSSGNHGAGIVGQYVWSLIRWDTRRFLEFLLHYERGFESDRKFDFGLLDAMELSQRLEEKCLD